MFVSPSTTPLPFQTLSESQLRDSRTRSVLTIGEPISPYHVPFTGLVAEFLRHPFFVIREE